MIEGGLRGVAIVFGVGLAVALAAALAGLCGGALWTLAVFAGALLLGLALVGALWRRTIHRGHTWREPADGADHTLRGRLRQALARPSRIVALGLAAALLGLALFGLWLTALAALAVGGAWGHALSRRQGANDDPLGDWVAALAMAAVLWPVSGIAEMAAASAIAPWRAELFIASVQGARIEVTPPDERQRMRLRASFNVPFSLARYPEAEWRRALAHDGSIPYTVPLVFEPALEMRLNARHHGVKGGRPLDGRVFVARHSIDGVAPVAGALGTGLWFQAGRHEIEFEWEPDGRTVQALREAPEHACFHLGNMADELDDMALLASDRRFTEPAQLVLQARYITPWRRFSLGRERGFGRLGSEVTRELFAVEAPFTAKALSDLRLARFGDPALVPCDRPSAMPSCQTDSCEPPDREATLRSAQSRLAAVQAQVARNLTLVSVAPAASAP